MLNVRINIVKIQIYLEEFIKIEIFVSSSFSLHHFQ